MIHREGEVEVQHGGGPVRSALTAANAARRALVPCDRHNPQRTTCLESTEGASDIHAPVGGKIVEVNTKVGSRPDLLTSDPYAAWLFRLEPSDGNELDSLDLLDAAGYKEAFGE
ncbi:glycine cleavage system protein H [Streptomyces sp. NPDC059072]|uniref:glycine cleavage system protein H n=1 Tax=Streptomyces sp. NPDC059072 TaxID=3346715 RepID=UPI0036BBF155